MIYRKEVRRVHCTRVSLPNVLENESVWEGPASITGFSKSDGSGPSLYGTAVKTCWDDKNLYISFLCDDEDILSGFTHRDDPLYEQEVVEVFIAPKRLEEYFEFNVSPRNIVFDSRIANTLDGTGFKGDPSWNCEGLRTVVKRLGSPADDLTVSKGFGPWEARIAIPFCSLGVRVPSLGQTWHVNFYRIKRNPVEEYSCWAPTFRDPAFFHVPQFFGELVFDL